MSNHITLVVLILQLIFRFSSTQFENAQELRDSRKALMKSLGIKRLPRTAPRQKDFLLRRYSAPKFMMGLFKEVNGGTVNGSLVNTSHSEEHYESERKFMSEAQVDTVIGFFKYDHDKSWSNIHQDVKLKFKTNLNSHDVVVRGGELKIFKRLPRDERISHGNCTISVYLMLSEEKSSMLLDTRDVHAWTSGWQTFNVTAAVKLWAQFPLTNHGFKIVVHHDHNELSPQSFGIVGTRGNLEKRPYLVGFVTTSRVFPTFTPEFVASRERRASVPGYLRNSGKSTGDCRLKKFFLRFRDVGLHNTIIAPKGYNMFFCQGKCTFPMDPSIQATNHAMLQSLMHYDDPTVAQPCCVPSDLKDLKLLFFDENNNVVLTDHPKMIATACKCH